MKKQKLAVKKKLFIPGIKVPELLEIQEFVPNIRINLAVISVILCIISQITIKNNKVPVESIKKMESVNYYIKNYLARLPLLVALQRQEEEVTYVAAAVAIRSTMMGDQGELELAEDFKDLSEVRSG